jgi:hypothetical protein
VAELKGMLNEANNNKINNNSMQVDDINDLSVYITVSKTLKGHAKKVFCLQKVGNYLKQRKFRSKYHPLEG